jgi:hypothetical protein
MNHDDEPYPCCVALLAATLALMTAHAEPEAEAKFDTATQRVLMARKIASNLFFLQHHPDLPPGLRTVAQRLQRRWAARGERELAPPRIDDDRAGAALH